MHCNLTADPRRYRTTGAGKSGRWCLRGTIENGCGGWRKRTGARGAVITRVFHEWERRLAAAAENRIVRPFEWGLEWLAELGHRHGEDEWAQLEAWAEERVANSEAFFAVAPATEYVLHGDRLRF